MSQTNAQLLADSLGTASTGTIPIGGIILWSGSTGSVPDGWRLCNGSNGTPNLQDRFVVGAGSGYAVNATGGSANAVVVSHNHGITDPGHSHAVNINVYQAGQGSNANTDMANRAANTQSVNATTGITINNEGVSGTNANLPPYYALAYIMRIA